MKRKIYFDLVAADKFETVDYGYTAKWDVPKGGDVFITGLPIEFEASDDYMKDAFEALYKYMQKYYPTKDYRIYYWILERIDDGS